MKVRVFVGSALGLALLCSGCGDGIDDELSGGVSTGSVRVTVGPAAAVAAGAGWLVDASSTQHASGETVAGLPVGTHAIRFAAAAGYAAPADQTVVIAADQTATATGTYTASAGSGSLQVTLAPAAAVTAGARWTLDSSATQHTSGETVSSLSTGAHTVHFSAAAGYTTPADQAVTVSAGQTATVSQTYVAQAQAISFATTVQPIAAASCTCHGSTMSTRSTLLSRGFVVAGNAAASPYVTKSSMRGYWGANRQTVVDWINQGANP